MQSFHDGPYRFIMTYQDHGLKTPWLAALRDKTVKSVVRELLIIFSFIGVCFAIPGATRTIKNARTMPDGLSPRSFRDSELTVAFVSGSLCELTEKPSMSSR